MINAIENVFIKQQEPTRSCLVAMHTIVLSHNTNFGEGLKYGMPLITYKEKPFCYMWVDKTTKYPYLLFVKGNEMNHGSLEQGDRKKMKIYTVNPNEDIDAEEIKEILEMAIALYD